MKEFNIKRLLAYVLALIILFMNIFSSKNISYAAINWALFKGDNIWKGKEALILGHKRNYLFKWKTGDTHTFCIEEGQHMGRDVRSSINKFYITDDNIPYLGSDKEMFRNLSLIGSWVANKRKGLSDADYTAAQVSIWMAMRSDLEGSISIANQINAHISGDVVSSTTDLLKYIEESKKDINLGNGIYVSDIEAAANPINMELVDGTYKTSIDLSKYPELKGRSWETPQNFIYEYSGNDLVISYKGEGSPKGLIHTKDVPNNLQKINSNSENLTIYIPDEDHKDQAMISAGLDKIPELYINLGGSDFDIPREGKVKIEVYKHSERFESNYRVELQKLDYETKKPLEGASFDVLESFDETQLGDGENGSLSAEYMSPKPSTWRGFRKFASVITDSLGKAEHRDKRYYEYEKIYVGHPEPEYLEVPQEQINEDGTNNSKEISAIQAENERLKEQWEAIVELCEERGYFHNNDIEVARKDMLEDRDATYENFINLKYKYTFKETLARAGYILHGIHNDDEPIEIIETNSSEAGAETTKDILNIDEINVSSENLARDLATRGFGTFGEENTSIIKSFYLPIVRKLNLFKMAKKDTNLEEIKNKISPDEAATPSEPKSTKLKLQSNFSKQILEENLEEATNSDAELEIIDDINFNTFKNRDKEEYKLSTFLEDDEDETYKGIDISIELPEAEEDDVAEVEKRDASKISYKFDVYNNRTEGEIHINKRDMELFSRDKEASYGKTQGDASLEGAVYGLFASSDIIHPDGNTGVVYKAGELLAVASTDKNGDASFLAYTKESETSLTKENKYGTWIGRPLILGSYYVKELSRSEGYELSVSGKNLKESNRNTDKNEEGFLLAGLVSAGSLSHKIDEHNGSTNDVDIDYYKTVNGFKVIISGYPKDTKFYEVDIKEKKSIERVVKDTLLATKTDALGNIIYKKAQGGELKLDATGKAKEMSGISSKVAENEVLQIKHRLNIYPSGHTSPKNPSSWEEAIDSNYLLEELNSMIKELGYKEIDGETSPWLKLKLSANTNKELGEKIIEALTKESFYDSAKIYSIEEIAGEYIVKIFVDYKGQSGNAFYEQKSNKVYVKKPLKVENIENAYTWLAYEKGSYSFRNFTVSISPKKEIEGELYLFDDISSHIKIVYQKEYERYLKGEELLDIDGKPIAEKEIKYIYKDEEVISRKETLKELKNVEFDEATGTYILSFPNEIDWDKVNEKRSIRLRLETKEKEIEVDGKDMYYSDYLSKVKGAGVSAVARAKDLDEGSYIKFANLVYPGQLQVFSDAGTRNEKLQVLERVIKQAIKVTKTVSKTSYYENNTYKIHKDPFTVLFGGYKNNGKEFVKGFNFRLYLVSDLEKEGLLDLKEDGTYDYKKLFYDESKKDILENLAINWDKKDKDIDNNPKTLSASLGNGKEAYYGISIMLPYGKYVIVEDVPTDLVNKHYELDEPKEVDLPFVPEIEEGNIREDIASSNYIYRASYSPEELVDKFKIRFNEESEIIKAHNNDGDFEIYPYGLKKDLFEREYENKEILKRYKYGQSENAGTKEKVYYEFYYDTSGNVLDYGVEKENVPTMTSKSVAIDGKYAKALVPYTVLDPRYGEEINDKGDIGNRDSGIDKEGNFNFISFLKSHFENTFYSSKLRIEKLDSETGENIIHEGALFKIYAAKRDVAGKGSTNVEGSGRVLFETKEIKGSREELEARGDVDNITWNEEEKTYIGSITSPIYDENEQIFLKNEFGNEVGIFKAYSTKAEVLKAEGSVEKRNLGYIETFSPLGAGVYVLVEVDAPKGYQKSKPIAFEVYKDETTYYEDGEKEARTKADRFQYVKPLTSSKDTLYTDLARIKVNDKPSTMKIHKVEDGDKFVGDVNGLDKLVGVNDKGDLLTYIIKGRKEYLEARGDVEDIRFNEKEKIYYGKVIKSFDKWSENLIKVDENTALASENMKPLYETETGFYSGYALRFDNYVKKATMSLYEGLELKKLGFASYEGVSVEKEGGKTTKIVANVKATGKYRDVKRLGKDLTPPYLPIYDMSEFDNEDVELYFYDLSKLKTEIGENGEIWALDDRGNRLSYVDLSSGLAYTKDDYGKIIAYKAKDGKKIVAKSIEIEKEEGGSEKIYENLASEKDENNLVKYYTSGNVSKKEEIWETDEKAHTIKRLPFGAYILEESKVPYEDGYIKVADKGLILRESSEVQDFFYENVFTKLNIAKIDITSKKEIKDATMSLYKATRVADDSKAGYHLEKGELYTSWISGYEYDDAGNIKLVDGKPIETKKPHWIDHIPIGDYILEESIVPYKDGYVKSESVEIEVKESGNVQTAFMEDDYTALEIKKYDTKTGKVLDNEHSARLSLYKADVDENGEAILKKTIDSSGKEVELPTYDKKNLIITWGTDDGKDVAASGRVVSDEYGETYTKYYYKKIKISNQTNAYYYIDEKGYTRFDYLPVGKYVLVEENTPIGYATANDMLIDIKDIGSKKEVQYYEMGDTPLRVNIHKQNRKKVVKDATLEIYKLGKDGKREEKPLYSFITGSDGTYSIEDEKNGKIAQGYSVGDLKPHLIEYIPLGKYVLVEKITPFGFIKAEEVEFEIVDSPNIQNVFMEDEIPKGKLEILKLDSESKKALRGAKFIYRNKDTNEVIEELITDDEGRAASSKEVPIGYLGNDGYFKSYTYEVLEVDAPNDYMLNSLAHEFIYAYKDENTISLTYSYDALNDINQVKISKKELTSKKELEGARLKVYEKDTKKLVDEWVSTKEVHYIKGLKEGKYILEEIATPEQGNYAKAESIEFEIVKNMTNIPFVEMFDDSSKVEIKKMDADRGIALEGAKLSLKDEKGQVLYEWSSTKEAHLITGLRAGIYYISEIEAPQGFEKASDIKIEVKDSFKEQEFIFNNYRIRSDAGVEVPNKRYITFKKTDDSGKALANVEFTFYKADKSILTQAKSNENGIIKIERPANGFYTFKETKGNDGYYKNDKTYILEVSDAGIKADFNIINVAFKKVVLVKKDIKTDKPLAGAKIRVSKDNKELTKLISDEKGEMSFIAKEIGIYILEEIEAPKGYKKSNARYVIEVKEDGSIFGDRIIYNDTKKIGKIILTYDNISYVIPKTGDYKAIFMHILILILSLASAFLLLNSKRKRIFYILLIFFISFLSYKTAYANTDILRIKANEDLDKIKFEDIEEKMHIQRSEKFEVEENKLKLSRISENKKENFKDKISYAGSEYKLLFVDSKNIDNEKIHRNIEKELIFTNLESDFEAPKVLDIKFIKDYGKEKEELDLNLILRDVQKINENWNENFEAKMLVYDYDADDFLLGNKMIAKSDILAYVNNNSSYILEILNLNKNFYKIEGVSWLDGEKWIDGKLCREAKIYGKKLSYDLIAKYTLSIDLEKKPSYENIAYYELISPNTIIEEKETNKTLLKNIIDFMKSPLGIIIFIATFFFSIFILLARRKLINKD